MQWSRVLPACIISLLSASCATLPEIRESPPKTADVVRHVRCELRDTALLPKNQWLLTDAGGKGWNVKLAFTLEVTHSGEVATGDNTWLFPLNGGATFLLNLSAGFSGEATRTENIEINQKLTELKRDPHLYCPDERLGRFDRLSGYIGISDLIERVSLSRDLLRGNAEFGSLSYTLDFDIKKTGNVAPSFRMIPIGKEKLFGSSPKWTGTYKDSQTVKFTFDALKADPPRELCSVVPADAVEPWPDPGKCPVAFYAVNARPACHILSVSDCRAEDCVKIAKNGKPACEVQCRILGDEKLCTDRRDCRWDGKACEAPGAVSSRRAPGSRSRTPDGLAPPVVSVPSPAPYVIRSAPTSESASGLSQAERDSLNNASGRNVLESIDARLRRQGN